jgi:hypothetical protein
MKKIFFLFLVLSFIGCMARQQPKAEWFSIGPSFEKVKTANIEIFKSRDEVKRPWGAIAVCYGKYIPDGSKTALKSETDKIVSLAAENGADAIIIKEVNVTSNSAYASEKYLKTPHIYLYATVIKYIDKLTEDEKNIIKKWETKTFDLQAPR